MLAPYQGTVVSGAAYDLLGGNPDWQKGEATFFLAARREGLGDAEYLAGVKQYLDRAREAFPGQGLIVLVEPEYVAGYELGQGPPGEVTEVRAWLERVAQICQRHPLPRGKKSFGYGQGLNAEF